jgi:hypothetical protein
MIRTEEKVLEILERWHQVKLNQRRLIDIDIPFKITEIGNFAKPKYREYRKQLNAQLRDLKADLKIWNAREKDHLVTLLRAMDLRRELDRI